MMRRLGHVMFVGVLALALLLGYNFARSTIAADFYRDRFHDELRRNEALRQSFNEVVRKNVVTELVVNEDDSVCVVFVDGNNEEKIVPTPFKKGAVVYVDFMMNDGRLYLRRLFDEKTAPADALVIDPQLQTVKTQPDSELFGNAPYARLNQRGRWVVNATHNGALELKKADDTAPREPIVRNLQVRDYKEIERDVNSKADEIGPQDVLNSLFGND